MIVDGVEMELDVEAMLERQRTCECRSCSALRSARVLIDERCEAIIERVKKTIAAYGDREPTMVEKVKLYHDASREQLEWSSRVTAAYYDLIAIGCTTPTIIFKRKS